MVFTLEENTIRATARRMTAPTIIALKWLLVLSSQWLARTLKRLLTGHIMARTVIWATEPPSPLPAK